VRLSDPSTVPVVLAAADRIGHELKGEYRQMTNAPRSGELLPEHLLASVEVVLMAKHRGRGIATIEYPTGMNQNGDPSQAWIKVKPDGRIDVFAGTVDVGQGSRPCTRRSSPTRSACPTTG
jgi:hypothetical protein